MFLGNRLVAGGDYNIRHRLLRWYLRRRGWMLEDNPRSWIGCWGGCSSEEKVRWMAMRQNFDSSMDRLEREANARGEEFPPTR